MNCEIKTYKLGNLCKVVTAKSHTLPVQSNGKVKSTLYVSAKYELRSTLATFTQEQKTTGYYLLSEHITDALYYSFLLNSSIGVISLHNDKNKSYTRGNVTKTKLVGMHINVIPKRYTRVCNILELMIRRMKGLLVEGQAIIARDATIAFLEDMRNYIALEIYMMSVFEKHQVSILKPWTDFIEREGNDYKISSLDNVFMSLYKSIVSPKNDILDAMKKVRLFVEELGKDLKGGDE